MISQIAALTANVVTEAPELGHGETAARPSPDPRLNRMSDTAAAAAAPAMMAGHETAEREASAVWPASPAPRIGAPAPSGIPDEVCIFSLPKALRVSARKEREEE